MSEPDEKSLTTFYWSNDAGNQGSLCVTPDGGIDVEVDDAYYSGKIESRYALSIAHELLINALGNQPDKSAPLSNLQKAHLQAVTRIVPADYRLIFRGVSHVLDVGAEKKLCEFLREVVLSIGARLHLRPATVAAMSLELSASLLVRAHGMSESEFLENARLWHSSVKLSEGVVGAVNSTTRGSS